jgi:hypothetical protein
VLIAERDPDPESSKPSENPRRLAAFAAMRVIHAAQLLSEFVIIEAVHTPTGDRQVALSSLASKSVRILGVSVTFRTQ